MAKQKEDPINSSGPAWEPEDYNAGEAQSTSKGDVARISDHIAMPVKQGAKRAHKATWATDKVNGGYLVRIIGPHANKFGGKIVPVVRADDSESEEELGRVVWSGVDTGTAERPGTNKPVALYTCVQKPKIQDDIEF